MLAVRIHEDGGPEVLRLEDAPDPAPGPGDVLVELRAASLNRLDVWIRRGLPSVPKPRILGADGAGVVREVGGRRRRRGGRRPRRDRPLARARRAHRRPRRAHRRDVRGAGRRAGRERASAAGGLSFAEAAAFPLTFETAYRMLVTRAGLRPGEWVLVWGPGSGVGTAALVLAKALGGARDRRPRRRTTSWSGRASSAPTRPCCTPRRTSSRPCAPRPRAAAPTSSSSTWARRRGRGRSPPPLRAAGSPSAARRPARIRPPHCTASGGSSSRSSARRWARPTTFAPCSSWSPAAVRGPSWTACSLSPRPPPRTSAWRAGEHFGKIVLEILGLGRDGPRR